MSEQKMQVDDVTPIIVDCGMTPTPPPAPAAAATPQQTPPPVPIIEKVQRHPPPSILRRSTLNRVFVIKKPDSINSPQILTPVPTAQPGATLQKFVYKNPSPQKPSSNSSEVNTGTSEKTEKSLDEKLVVPASSNLNVPVVKKVITETPTQNTITVSLTPTSEVQNTSIQNTITVNLTQPPTRIRQEVSGQCSPEVNVCSSGPTTVIPLEKLIHNPPSYQLTPVTVSSSTGSHNPLSYQLTPLTVTSSTCSIQTPRIFFQPTLKSILLPVTTAITRPQGYQTILNSSITPQGLNVKMVPSTTNQVQNIIQPSLKSPEKSDNLPAEVEEILPTKIRTPQIEEKNENLTGSTEGNSTGKQLIVINNRKTNKKNKVAATKKAIPKIPKGITVTKAPAESSEGREGQQEVSSSSGEVVTDPMSAVVEDEAGIVTLTHEPYSAEGNSEEQDSLEQPKRLIRKFYLASQKKADNLPKKVVNVEPVPLPSNKKRRTIIPTVIQKEDGPQRSLVPRILSREYNVLRHRVERIVLMPMREVCVTEAETQTEEEDRLQSSFSRSPQLLKPLEKEETAKVLGKRIHTDSIVDQNEPPTKKQSPLNPIVSGNPSKTIISRRDVPDQNQANVPMKKTTEPDLQANNTERVYPQNKQSRIERQNIEEDVEMKDIDFDMQVEGVDQQNQLKAKKKSEKKRKLMKDKMDKLNLKNRGITITRDVSHIRDPPDVKERVIEVEYGLDEILNMGNKKMKEIPPDVKNKLEKISLVCNKRGLRRSEIEKAKMDFDRCLVPDNFGNLPIHQAVISRHTKDIIRHCMVLAAHNRTVDIRNNAGLTPLHLSFIHNCNRNAIQKLLRYGGGLTLKDPKGNNVLHLAVMFSSPSGLEAVLPLVLDLVNEINEDGMSPLHLAVIEGKTEHVHFLLSVPTIDLDLPDSKSGRTALFHALESGHFDLARLLVKRGSSIEATNFAGQSILTLAAENESYKDIISVISRRRILQNKKNNKINKKRNK